MHSIEVRPDRIVVVYDVAPKDYMEVYDDAATRRLSGWRMLSIDSQALGFMGSAGNLLFNTGGGSATEVRYTVLYEQLDAPTA